MRCVEKVIRLDEFEDIFAPILFCLEETILNMGPVCDQNTSAKATSFCKLMTFFGFLSSLVITRSIVDPTLPTTQLLQSHAIDNADATHLIESLKRPIVANAILLIAFIKNYTVIVLNLIAR